MMTDRGAYYLLRPRTFRCARPRLLYASRSDGGLCCGRVLVKFACSDRLQSARSTGLQERVSMRKIIARGASALSCGLHRRPAAGRRRDRWSQDDRRHAIVSAPAVLVGRNFRWRRRQGRGDAARRPLSAAFICSQVGRSLAEADMQYARSRPSRLWRPRRSAAPVAGAITDAATMGHDHATPQSYQSATTLAASLPADHHGGCHTQDATARVPAARWQLEVVHLGDLLSRSRGEVGSTSAIRVEGVPRAPRIAPTSLRAAPALTLGEGPFLRTGSPPSPLLPGERRG